jgi:hypothetical protein
MVSCRYVGSDCALIGDTEFDTVGQLATFSEQGFSEVVLGHAFFIRDADFKACNFTQEELDQFGQSGMRIDPTPSFTSKLAMAQQIFCDTYARMLVEKNQVLAEASDADVRDPEPVVDL